MHNIFPSNDKGSVIASVNLLIAAILVLAAAGWPFVQRGCHAYYHREAWAFFEKIEQKQISYKNVHGKYLPFPFLENSKALKKLKVNPQDAKYYTFRVEVPRTNTFRIIAALKPEILKKWYLHNPKTKLRLVYEKKDKQKGRIVRQ